MLVRTVFRRYRSTLLLLLYNDITMMHNCTSWKSTNLTASCEGLNIMLYNWCIFLLMKNKRGWKTSNIQKQHYRIWNLLALWKKSTFAKDQQAYICLHSSNIHNFGTLKLLNSKTECSKSTEVHFTYWTTMHSGLHEKQTCFIKMQTGMCC